MLVLVVEIDVHGVRDGELFDLLAFFCGEIFEEGEDEIPCVAEIEVRCIQREVDADLAKAERVEREDRVSGVVANYQRWGWLDAGVEVVEAWILVGGLIDLEFDDAFWQGKLPYNIAYLRWEFREEVEFGQWLQDARYCSWAVVSIFAVSELHIG